MQAAGVPPTQLAVCLEGTLGADFLNGAFLTHPVSRPKRVHHEYQQFVKKLLRLRGTAEFPIREPDLANPAGQSLLLVDAIADCLPASDADRRRYREQLKGALALHELDRLKLTLP
jgi:hypothetical protein